MKTYTPYPVAIAALLLLFFLQGCISDPGTWRNDRIAAGKRDDLHELNERALTFLKSDNYKGIRLMFSRELLDNSYMETNVEHISNYLNDTKYDLVDEYYVINKYID